MPLSRREILSQVQGLIDAEKRVEARSGAISEEELDLQGFTEEAGAESLGQTPQLPPSDIPLLRTSQPGLSADGLNRLT